MSYDEQRISDQIDGGLHRQKMEYFEENLIVGAKIKIGKEYAKESRFTEGEIITLELLPFEYDSDFGGGVEDAPGVFNGYDNDSIYHLFGNNFEWWMDNEIIVSV